MAVFNILERPIFNSRYKYPIHIAQVVFCILAFALTVPRLFITNVPRTRAGTYALGMSAKSLALLAYLMLSEHHPRFQRWYSPKAHAVISCIEVVFWSVVFGLMFSTNVSYCKGVTCGLGWIVVIIAVIMVVSEIIVAGISIREFREWKRAGKPKTMDTKQHHSRTFADEEYGVPQVAEQSKGAHVQAAERAYFQSERRHSQRSHSKHERQPSWETQTAPREKRRSRSHHARRSSDRRRSQEKRYVQHSETPRYQGQQEPRDSRY